MRQPLDPQKQLGEVDISEIRFNERSRDDPRILCGLQHIYTTPELRQAVFQILEQAIPENINHNNGRPGMDLWRMLVPGTLRLTINCDYDRLLELANEHGTLRQMLGHGPYDEHTYRLQTVDCPLSNAMWPLPLSVIICNGWADFYWKGTEGTLLFKKERPERTKYPAMN